MDAPRVRFSIFRWRVLLALVVLLIVASPFLYRASRIVGLPDPGAPFDVDEFGTVEIAIADNAAAEYRAAEAWLGASSPHPDQREAAQADWNDATPEVVQWLEQNRRALEEWRRATEKPVALGTQPGEITIHDYVTLISVFAAREFGWLALAEAQRLRSAGRLNEAWEWYRAAFRASRHIGQYGGFVERLIGVAQHSATAQAMVEWSRDARLSADAVLDALHGVQADYEMTAPVSTTLKIDYLGFEQALALPDLSEISGVTGADTRGTLLVRAKLYLRNERELTRRLGRHYYANFLAFVDQPRHARPAITASGLFDDAADPPSGDGRLPADEIEPLMGRSKVAPLMLSHLELIVAACDREHARQATLEGALAVEWHRRVTGTTPESIVDVLDGERVSIRPDPFGKADEPIRYRREPDGGFVVWSVAHDGVDGGGTSLNWQDGPCDYGFAVGPPLP